MWSFATLLAGASLAQYEPNWPSLMSRPLPQWFDQSKIGIFIHWGVYSVPSYGPTNASYRGMPAEWYWHSLVRDDPNVVAFHERVYGQDFTYADFGPMFKAELFDPDDWAILFKKAGIKYVVLTSKHHEGFTNWCSAESFNWNACDMGPKRDLVGALSESVKAAGLHMGLYLSMYEWYHPLYLQDVANNFTTSRYVDEVYWPQAKEINNLYQPDLMWSDGDIGNASWWRSPEFLAWLYNEAPNRDSVIVNDRWGIDNPPIGSGKHFGGYFSGRDRQAASSTMLNHKWESAFTLDEANWGYARNDDLNLYLNFSAVLYQVVSTVAYGGNALINIGPTADGHIPIIFQERLLELGAWLEINGEAIYSTTMWREQNDTAVNGVGHGVFYTATTDAVYAIALDWPPNNTLTLRMPTTTKTTSVSMLGCSKSMGWMPASGSSTGVIITVPALMPTELPSPQGPWVFKLAGVQ